MTSTGAAEAQPPTVSAPADSAARRAMRVAAEIGRLSATEAERAAAYARSGAILDSLDAANGKSDLTRHARGVAALYRTEATLSDAERAPSSEIRCATAHRARTFADSVQVFIPGADESPSAAYRAVLARTWELVRATGSRAAEACR